MCSSAPCNAGLHLVSPNKQLERTVAMPDFYHPTGVLFVAFLLCLCAESWFSWRFLRDLRKLYPKLWLRSGKRTAWTDMDLSSALQTSCSYLDRSRELRGGVFHDL